jgi:hypothetical protein
MERFKNFNRGADVEWKIERGKTKGKTSIVRAIGHLPFLN